MNKTEPIHASVSGMMPGRRMKIRAQRDVWSPSHHSARALLDQ